MSGFSVRVNLNKAAADALRRGDSLFPEGKPPSVRVSGISTPEECGPHRSASVEEIDRLVNHVLVFNRRVLQIIDLGENIPLIAVAQGTRPASGRRCDAHTLFHVGCPDCQKLCEGDDSTVSYALPGYGFSTLADAIVFAIALRDRGEPNDAGHTATAVGRLLRG